ncbi:amidohydrolase 3 [Lasiosphaeria ovina]|uniref:Amidohydrolase 3 n=1 Tax=Lasiosphaeria ovina TaxID=92902 RepID=A0AAE0TX05_9PEZI|nr:amidohydrolase 3 [Lasiosphaeria ovina]
MPATLFTNGRIFQSGVRPGTNAGLHGEPTFAESLLVRGDVIEYVGPASGLPPTADHDTVRVRDLGGRTVLPGFVDGHMHLMLLGQSLNKLDLGACKTLCDIQAAIRAHAAANPDAPRILCRNWMHSMTDPTGVVSSADLDTLDDAARPIFVDSKDLHSTWCSSSALAELGAEAWPPVPGGKAVRDAHGRLTGVISEAANFTYVWPHLAQAAAMADRVAAIKAAVAAYHSAGYTGLIDMAMDEGSWDALQALQAADSRIPMRIAAYWLIRPGQSDAEHVAQVDRAIELARAHDATSSPDCRVVGIKVICDGVVDACTAGLSEPYTHNGANVHPTWTAAQLAPVVQRADAAGLQVAIHAIGDATVTAAVDVLTAHASPARRPRVEHVELASAADAARLGAARITASVQPVHADPAILRAWPALLGASRCGRAFAYRELADAGAPLALGSDAPTAPHSPLGNVYVGTTRKSFRDPAALDQPVNPHFALGLCEAVAAATEGAAYSCFDDARIGVLKKGHKADFVVVDMQWDREKLLEARTKETWFAGEKVWAAETE